MPFRPALLPLALAASLGLAVSTTGCLHVQHGHAAASAGPPPFAPAHGYRHRHQGADLVFDVGLGVYAVVGLPGIYFHRDHYLRVHAGVWQRAARTKGPWVVASTRKLPTRLHKHVARRQGKRKAKR